MRHRLGGAILAAIAALLAAVGHGHGQQAAAPPRLLDLESEAIPLPSTGWRVIATSPLPGAPGSGPPVATAPGSITPVANAPGSPRRPAGAIRPVVYEPTDPEPPNPAPSPARPSGNSSNALVPDGPEPAANAGPVNAGRPPPGAPGAAAPAAVVSPLPPAGTALSLEVVGPSQAAPGQAMTVEIIARNTGAGTLARVRVEVPLPPGTRLLQSDPPAETQGDRLAWSLGSIHAGAERHLRLELQPAAGEWSLVPVASFAPEVGLRTPIVEPPFALSVSGPETVASGAEIDFQIRASNHTKDPLEKVIVRVQLPPGLFQAEAAKAHGRIDTFPIKLAPGETRTLPLKVLAQAPGRQMVEVSTSPESRHPAPPARTVVVVTDPPLAVRLEGPRTAALGRDFDLLLEVSNPTQVPAANVRLAQSVPQGLQVTSSPGATPGADGQSIVWSLGPLGPGQRRSCTCTLRPRAGGEWPLYAAAAADNAGESRASHAVRVEGSPPLTLEVRGQDDSHPLAVGAETVYEVRVLNNSDLPASNVQLVAWMPDELEPVNPQGPTDAQVQTSKVLFAPLARLDPHADAVYRVSARARQAGQGRFRVEMSANQLARPLLQECVAVVQGP